MKNTFLKLYFILLALAVCNLAYAQKAGIYFDKLDVKKGLPEGNARAMAEDKDGYIWIGTQNGLVRYDGYNSRIYNLGSVKLNKDATTNAYSIIVDKNNTLWVTAINNGLFRYNRQTDSFDQFVFPKKHPIATFLLTAIDDAGNVWGRAVSWDRVFMAVKFDAQTLQYTTFSKAEKGNNYINSTNVNSVYKTSAGDILLTTLNGFYRYNGPDKPLTGYLTTADTAKTRGVNPIYEAPSEPGVLWMNTFHGNNNIDLAVTRFDLHSGAVKEYRPSKARDSIFDAGFSDVHEDKQKRLWFATEQGLSMLDRKTGKFSNYLPGDTVGKNSNNSLYDFRETKQGNLWLSTSQELIYFDTHTNHYERYKPNSGVPGALPGNYIISKLVDHTGVLWVGSNKAGAGRINYSKSAFTILKPVPGQPNKYPETFGVTPATNEYSWATGKHGIYKWYNATNEFVKQYAPGAGEEYNALVKQGKNDVLYTATNTKVILYHTITGKKEEYPIAGDGITPTRDDGINNIFLDHTGILWVARGSSGIASFDPVTKKFKGYPYRQGYFSEKRIDDGKLDDNRVLSMFEDSQNTFWVGTNNGGLNKFDRKTQRFTSYYNGNNKQLYCIDDIFEDKQGRLWLGTYLTGIFIFDRDKGAYTHQFNERSGLLFNSESGLNTDDKGRIWMLSERGLSRIDSKNGTVRNFEFNKILPGADLQSQISMLSSLPNGRFGFAIKTGYVTFNPHDLDDNPNPPIVHIENIGYSDPLGDGRSANKLMRYGLKSLELKHNQNRLQFNYIALHFDDPEKNTYAYKLDGYDKQWVQAGTQRSATYTNLPAGNYTFHVKAANSDGVWNNVGDSITITILSPWWGRWWAWLLYICAFAFVVYAYVNYRQRQLKTENRLLEEKIDERTHELSQVNKTLSEQSEEITAQRDQLADTVNELKSTQQQLVQSEKLASLGELTAGIAHEIQNPLNFVNNFSEVSIELVAEMKDEFNAGNTEEAMDIAADIEQNLQKIMHHGKRADAIVKNMLQHSRNNSGDKQLTDLNALADEYLRLAYHGLRAKDKSFNAALVTNFDNALPRVTAIPQDIGRVLLNMINNAFYALQQRQKISDNGYKPTLELITAQNNGWVELTVKDNGTGMPEHVKEKIMQPFFTTKPTGEGTGLGLSLSYDIVVKGHGGKIDVTSKEGEGTTFVISLPLV
jgi:signal transduction histidine kinase/ligand-binding sensor domain-containing protein